MYEYPDKPVFAESKGKKRCSSTLHKHTGNPDKIIPERKRRSVAVDLFALPFHIRGVPDSNHGPKTRYPEVFMVSFNSIRYIPR
jgi:hypothetical protein